MQESAFQHRTSRSWLHWSGWPPQRGRADGGHGGQPARGDSAGDKLESEGWYSPDNWPVIDESVRSPDEIRSEARARSKPAIWPVIEASVADACAGPAHLLLQQLAALEMPLRGATECPGRRLNVGGRKNASLDRLCGRV